MARSAALHLTILAATLTGGLLVVGCRETHVVLALDAGGVGGSGPPDGGRPDDAGPPGPATTASMGRGHTCALAGGAIYCWGDNRNSQLGLGDTREQHTPARVGADGDWTAVVTSANATFALKQDGSLWSWGANDDGQLGLGDFDNRASPTRVGTRSDWTMVRSRFYHACGLTGDGALWCWGRNDEGQLGQNRSNLSDVPVPTQVTDLANWASTDAGDGHSCAIRSDGTLWCWGRNSEAELAQPEGAPVQIRYPVQAGDATDWEAISAGQNAMCGLRSGGRLYCWGARGDQDLPIPGPRSIVYAPTEISTPVSFIAVAFNTFGGCARTAAGEGYCWGRNQEGQLGLGDIEPRDLPTEIPGTGWTDVSPGRFAFCGVRAGVVTCTGDNSEGQLGDGTTSRRNTMGAVILP
jgi:alpha-tubulin suppressor-like RCC1 family protein